MEGSLSAAYGVLAGPRQVSWTFSIPKVGEPVQHYSLEKIPWHAGLPGDQRQDTSLIGNLTLIGKEHEGVEGEPWTENQLFWSAKIDVACRALCPPFGANPPTLRLNIFWHTWLSATSCPSGRNPDEEKIALINEWEDRMTDAEFLEKLNRLLTQARITTTQEDGKTPTSGKWTLGHWLNASRVHQLNKVRHDGGGLKRGDTVKLS